MKSSKYSPHNHPTSKKHQVPRNIMSSDTYRGRYVVGKWVLFQVKRTYRRFLQCCKFEQAFESSRCVWLVPGPRMQMCSFPFWLEEMICARLQCTSRVDYRDLQHSSALCPVSRRLLMVCTKASHYAESSACPLRD